MKRHLTASVLVILCAAGSAADLLACGDKYLVPARGTRFYKPSFARQDASILLYASDTSELFRMMNKLSFDARLQKAGYRPRIVRTDPELASALAQRRWDLVVVDAADVSRMDDSRRDATGPAVLPVSYTLTGEQWKRARQQYPALVKAPKNSGAFLEMIDAALEKQLATRAKRP